MTENTVFCRDCGEKIKAKAEICPKCGVRQRSIIGGGPKDKTTAAILALLLGGIGVHKFYLGSPLSGLIYLVFCWTFIPAILGVIECISLLLMNQEKFDEKFNRL